MTDNSFASGGMPWLWARSGEVLARFDYEPEDHEILRSGLYTSVEVLNVDFIAHQYVTCNTVVFLVISQLYSTFTELPFSLYSTFVIGESRDYSSGDQ